VRELRSFEIEERAAVARPVPAHAGPAQASLQDAEGQDLEILVVRARFLAGKAAAALLLCERTFPGRAVTHATFRLSSSAPRVLDVTDLWPVGRAKWSYEPTRVGTAEAGSVLPRSVVIRSRPTPPRPSAIRSFRRLFDRSRVLARQLPRDGHDETVRRLHAHVPCARLSRRFGGHRGAEYATADRSGRRPHEDRQPRSAG